MPGSAVFTCKSRPLGSGDTPAPAAPAQTYSSDPEPVYVPHEHSYSWKEATQATEDNNGEMIYICEGCGDVLYRVPLSAYAVFNANAKSKIDNAGSNSVVTVATDRWISFHRSVLEALAARPDVTLEVKFLSEGHKGEAMNFVIPAGTDVMSLLAGEDYCGFIYLYNRMYNSVLPVSEQTGSKQAASEDANVNNPSDSAVNDIANQTSRNNNTSDRSVSADNSITITIPRGVESYYVAKLLEQAGVVDSAAVFDRYLCNNGYDRRIQIGTKAIPTNADYEQIARIITRY